MDIISSMYFTDKSIVKVWSFHWIYFVSFKSILVEWWKGSCFNHYQPINLTSMFFCAHSLIFISLWKNYMVLILCQPLITWDPLLLFLWLGQVHVGVHVGAVTLSFNHVYYCLSFTYDSIWFKDFDNILQCYYK